MNDRAESRNRRTFLADTGAVASAAALGSTLTAGEAHAAEPQPTGAVNALLPTSEQMQAFLALPDDGPVVMVNLLKFKPEGGAAEYAKYAAGIQPILEKIGAKVLFSGRAEYCLIGQADWDMVALVQYPNKKSLVQMSMSPEYQAIHPLRVAGLQGQINYAVTANEAPPAAATKAVGADEIRPGVLRTPDERFAGLAGFDFEPHYHEIAGYRMHYLDEGPRHGEAIVLLHGEPTWSYLYRKMVPVLTAGGYRCVVPDLIGFGRSDKPIDSAVHTYKFHVDTVAALLEKIALQNGTLFGQDWGGLIGLRVVAENPARFARVVISNTGLPTGDEQITPAFLAWKRMSQQMAERGDMPIGSLVAGSAKNPALQQAYDAPFPDKRFKAGPLKMPQLVPITPEDPANLANKQAWQVLRGWQKPFLTAFGDNDPITGGAEKRFQQEIPGCRKQVNVTIHGGSHFIQESHGEELARTIIAFIKQNPLPKA